MIQLAATPSQLYANHVQSKTTLIVDTSLMWELLDYACEQRSLKTSDRAIYHSSLCEPASYEEPPHYLRVRVFHHPRFQIDATDGGQERPPLAELSPVSSLVRPRSGQDPSSMPKRQRTQHTGAAISGNASERFSYLDRGGSNMPPGVNSHLVSQDIPESEVHPPTQESPMWLGPENMRYGLFADMDLDLTFDANPNSWNFGTL